jgi:hypothetical protein
MTRSGCMYDHPMIYCMQCGCWMHCRRDGVDLEYHRRPDRAEWPQMFDGESGTYGDWQCSVCKPFPVWLAK